MSYLAALVSGVNVVRSRVQCCFMSAAGDRTDYSGRGAQDVHLDFHTAPGL